MYIFLSVGSKVEDDQFGGFVLTCLLLSSSMLFFSFILILPFVCSIHFKITRFNQSSEIAYQGDARAKRSVELTSINFTCRAGWVTYGKEVPLWDQVIGFAFFLAPARIRMPSNFSWVSLIKPALSLPLSHAFRYTFTNTNWDPVDMTSHVGINNNSLTSSNVTSWNATYNKTSDPKENSGLSYIIDLSKVLPPEVTIGFSASTGSFSEGNRLLSWEYSSSLEPRDIKKIETDRKVMIIGVSVTGFVLVTFLVVSFY
ncbi:hypothetical protein F2Q70_00005818 [Brassica cretica]|uniref:Legume lectin domain-containing protein n=1 Tax=Brassica cretica TaxID=69181 RepID=A0A8S9IRD3_BRACR|nr:hypothetical protein F2Q70_00005818 [Brassica cretica]